MEGGGKYSYYILPALISYIGFVKDDRVLLLPSGFINDSFCFWPRAKMIISSI